MDNMNKMKIRLNATADVREFVRAAEKCDFDVDIQYDSTIVDAKSILGIFSLDVTKPLELVIYDDEKNAEQYQGLITTFAA